MREFEIFPHQEKPITDCNTIWTGHEELIFKIQQNRKGIFRFVCYSVRS